MNYCTIGVYNVEYFMYLKLDLSSMPFPLRCLIDHEQIIADYQNHSSSWLLGYKAVIEIAVWLFNRWFNPSFYPSVLLFSLIYSPTIPVPISTINGNTNESFAVVCVDEKVTETPYSTYVHGTSELTYKTYIEQVFLSVKCCNSHKY